MENCVFKKVLQFNIFFLQINSTQIFLVKSKSAPPTLRFVPQADSPSSKSSIFSPKLQLSTTCESDSSFSSPRPIRVKKLKLRSRKYQNGQFSDETITESPYENTDSNFEVENMKTFSTPNIKIKKSFWFRAFCCVGK